MPVLDDETEIVDKIQIVRESNNRFWCELIRIAIKWAPKETKRVLDSIEENDRKINDLWRSLRDQL